MPGADRIGSNQYFAWMYDARLTIARRELKRSGERYDVLTLRGFVPVEGGMRRRLPEVHSDNVSSLVERQGPSK